MNRLALMALAASAVVALAAPAVAQNTYRTGSGTAATASTPVVCPDPTSGAVASCNALPTGASTAAAQTTGNASLATIVTNTATTPSTAVVETPTSVALTAGLAADVLSSNTSRKGWCVQASNTNSAVVMVAGNATATSGLGVEVMPGSQICNLAPFVGTARISAWSSAAATVRVVSFQ